MARLDVGAQPSVVPDSPARVDIGTLAVAAGTALRLQRPDLDVQVDDETGATTVAGAPDELRRALTTCSTMPAPQHRPAVRSVSARAWTPAG